MKKEFTDTYVNDRWKMHLGESKSGDGSALIYTENYRENLLKIIKDFKINIMVDCSCGDWNWMKEIKTKLPKYIGIDIVEELIEENKKKYGSDNIEFICNDMLTQLKEYNNKEIDLTTCRHTLEHLPIEYSLEVLRELKRVSKYSIIGSGNGSENNFVDFIMDGYKGRIVNLDCEPYHSELNSPIIKFPDIKKGNPIGYFGYVYKF